MDASDGMNCAFARAGRWGEPTEAALIIDAHAHLGPVPGFPYVDGRLDGMIATMDRLGIRLACVSGTGAIFGPEKRGNDSVLEAMRRYPDRIRGYMVINAGYPEVILPELERCLAAGFAGIKIWSYGDREGLPYDHPHYRPVFEFANAHRLPLLAHTWGGEVTQLEPAFQRYPEIRFLLAHAGSADLACYIRAVNTYEHVHVDTSLSACPRGLVERLVAEMPLSKICWGSDQPFLNAAHQLGRVLFARITPEQKRAILGENAARLFC